MVKVVWTDDAIEDLKSINKFISIDSPKNANRFSNKILDKTEILSNFPNLGRVVPEFNVESIRELIEGNYRIIYQIQDLKVEVIRIHHTSQKF